MNRREREKEWNGLCENVSSRVESFFFYARSFFPKFISSFFRPFVILSDSSSVGRPMSMQDSQKLMKYGQKSKSELVFQKIIFECLKH